MSTTTKPIPSRAANAESNPKPDSAVVASDQRPGAWGGPGLATQNEMLAASNQEGKADTEQPKERVREREQEPKGEHGPTQSDTAAASPDITAPPQGLLKLAQAVDASENSSSQGGPAERSVATEQGGEQGNGGSSLWWIGGGGLALVGAGLAVGGGGGSGDGGSGGGQAAAPENARPSIRSNGGGDTARVTVIENSTVVTNVEGPTTLTAKQTA